MATGVSVKRILLPVDGSPSSEKAADYAVHIAKVENAELIIIHAVEDIKTGGAIDLQQRYGNVSLVEAFANTRRDNALKYIAPLEEAAKKQGVKVKSEILIEPGESEVESVTKYAERNNADLIVIGTRGMSKFKRLLVGSVSTGVVNYAPCPVLIVR